MAQKAGPTKSITSAARRACPLHAPGSQPTAFGGVFLNLLHILRCKK